MSYKSAAGCGETEGGRSGSSRAQRKCHRGSSAGLEVLGGQGGCSIQDTAGNGPFPAPFCPPPPQNCPPPPPPPPPPHKKPPPPHPTHPPPPPPRPPPPPPPAPPPPHTPPPPPPPPPILDTQTHTHTRFWTEEWIDSWGHQTFNLSTTGIWGQIILVGEEGQSFAL